MIFDRKEFIKVLDTASRGLSTRGVVENLDCFCFKDNKIVTFSGGVRAELSFPYSIYGMVPGKELLTLLEKFPDEKIDVDQKEKNGEIRFKGESRKAGISCAAEMLFVGEDLEQPDFTTKTNSLNDKFLSVLSSASKVCGRNDALAATTCIEIAPDHIAACDNQRAFYSKLTTGFSDSFYFPAAIVGSLKGLTITGFVVQSGWCYFQLAELGYIGIRGRMFESFPDIKSIDFKNGSKLTLPKSILLGVDRAKTFCDDVGHLTRISIQLEAGLVHLRSQSGKGWYEESFVVDYLGDSIGFSTHPDSLVQILKHSESVELGRGKIKADLGDSYYLISTRMDEK